MGLLAAIGWRVLPRIDIGPLSVSPHGLGIAIGYALGGALTAKRAERMHGVARDQTWNALMWAVLGVIVGSRLFYVVGHIDDYWPNLLDIFKVWEGGIVFYGGVFGGIAAAIPFLRRHGIGIWKMLDAAAPGFPVGLIIGRIGDLVIGDHLGDPSTLPWAYRYEGGELPECPIGPGQCVPGMTFHQTALYDWVNALILLPLVFWMGRKRRPDGFLIMFTASWYAVGRLASDLARSAPTYAGLSGTQWVSVALILGGIAAMVRMLRRPPVLEPEDTEEAQAAEMVAEGGPVAGGPRRGAEPPEEPPDGPGAGST